MGIAGTLLSILGALAYALACTAAGTVALRLLLGDGLARHGLPLRLGSAFAFGHGLLTVMWVGLALGGAFRTPILLGILLVAGMAGLPPLLGWLRQGLPRWRTEFHALGWESKAIAGGIMFLVGAYGLRSLAPYIQSDAVALYLVVPRLVALTEELALSWINYAPFFSYSAESHYAVLFKLAREQTVLLFDYLVGLNLLLGAYVLARVAGANRRASLLVVLTMLSVQAFNNAFGAGKVDVAAAQLGVFALAALFVALNHRETLAPRRWLVLAGLLAGFSVSAKVSNALLFPLMGIPLLGYWIEHKGALKKVLQFGVILFGMAVLGMLPHFIKSYLMVGEPFIPFFHFAPQADLPNWASAAPNVLALVHSQRILSTVDLALLPLTWTFVNREWMDGNLSPLFLAFLPLGLWFRWPRAMKTAALMALAGIAAWLIVSPWTIQTRYHFIALALLAVPAGWIIDQVLSIRRMRPVVLIGLVLVMGITFVNARKIRWAIPYALGIYDRDIFFEKNFVLAPPHRIGTFVNQHIAPGERIYLARCDWLSVYFMEDRVWLQSQQPEEALTTYRLDWGPEAWQYLYDRGFDWVQVCNSDKGLLTGEPARSKLAALPAHLAMTPAFAQDNLVIYRLGSAPAPSP